jgi:hypothetical protein
MFQLAAGVAVFGVTCLVANSYINFNSTPEFMRSVKYSSVTPKLGLYINNSAYTYEGLCTKVP